MSPLDKKYLLIILVINAVLIGVIGNRGPSSAREAVALFAMANIAENNQVALPIAFEKYPETVNTSTGKCLAPQPLWFQVVGSVSYKIGKVFFNVTQSWDGMRKYFRLSSFLGNLIASSLLIFIFSQAMFVKGITGRDYLLLTIPLVFFSLAFTSSMYLNEHIFPAVFAIWAMNYINGGIYFINRGLPFSKSFIIAGIIFGFAAALSLPAIGLGIGFLAMFVMQKEKRFQRAAVDILIGSLVPIILTTILCAIYSRTSGIYIPPWPEMARAEGVAPGEALRYVFHSTFGLNGFFIYSPLAFIGIISLVKRLNHFQRMLEKRKKLDFYARGQSLVTWGVYWGGIITLAVFWIMAVMNGIPPRFQGAHLQLSVFTLGADKITLPSNLRPFGTPMFLFLLPVLHYFNLHIFREKPFRDFKFYYHEIVRIGGLVAWIGLAAPIGGYVVPFIWAVHKIAIFMCDRFPAGTLLW